MKVPVTTDLTLGEKQRLFMELLARLITYIYAQGHECTGGDLWAKEGHMPNSNHYKRLAIDLNLFKDGVYLVTYEDHKKFGEFWKSLHPLCRWGGDFKNKDGNHYSLEHEGRA